MNIGPWQVFITATTKKVYNNLMKLMIMFKQPAPRLS